MLFRDDVVYILIKFNRKMIKLKQFILLSICISLIFSQEIEQDGHVEHQIEDIEELIDPNNYRTLTSTGLGELCMK